MNKNLGIVNHRSLNFNNPKDLFSYTFHKEENGNIGKFRNRPILNLNNEGLNFSSKKTINNQINRNLIEPGIFNATEKLKEKEAIENYGGKKMNRFKQRKIKQWRNEFIEDNNKY